MTGGASPGGAPDAEDPARANTSSPRNEGGQLAAMHMAFAV